jgi:beta-xylosidase
MGRYLFLLSYISVLATAAGVPFQDVNHHQAVFNPDSTRSSTVKGPVMNHNFPDPAIVKYDGVWYAFGTNNAPSPRPYVQVATSYDFEKWTLNMHDALLDTGPWSIGKATWSPSVIQRVCLS